MSNTMLPLLQDKYMQMIRDNKWLYDDHIDHFSLLVKHYTEYVPQKAWRVDLPDTIEAISPTVKHIQILHSGETKSDEHWVCAYFDTKSIFIYDSLNQKKLHKRHEIYLRKLFPFYQFDKKPIKFPTVQHQLNSFDCGVFAIAFAISLINGHKPHKITYDSSLMRTHLLKIFENNKILNFPRIGTMRGSVTQKNLDARKRHECCESMQQQKNRESVKNHETVKKYSEKDGTETPSRIHNSQAFCKIAAGVSSAGMFNTKVPFVEINRENHQIADNLLVTQACNVSTDVTFTVTDKKSRRRDRRNVCPILSDVSRDIIKSGGWLTDLHMEQFVYLVKSCSEFSPRETWRLQMVDTIVPVSPTVKHVQILHIGENHWVCAYFDTELIYIYDSLNTKRLPMNYDKFLRKLFPFYQFDTKPIHPNSTQSTIRWLLAGRNLTK